MFGDPLSTSEGVGVRINFKCGCSNAWNAIILGKGGCSNNLTHYNTYIWTPYCFWLLWSNLWLCWDGVGVCTFIIYLVYTPIIYISHRPAWQTFSHIGWSVFHSLQRGHLYIPVTQRWSHGERGSTVHVLVLRCVYLISKARKNRQLE